MRHPLLAALFAIALLASPLRAQDEPSGEGQSGIEIGAAPTSEGGAGLGGHSEEAKKPSSGGRSGGSSSGGGISGGMRPLGSSPAAKLATKPETEHAAAPAENLGPDTPSRHRQTTVPLVAPPDTGSNSHETFNPYRSVSNGASCYEAAKVFDLWQLWHFRRMNGIADITAGCANIPAAQQAQIILIQAQNALASQRMSKLAVTRVGDHGDYDDHCDEIIQIYRDNLEWSNLSMFFKGRNGGRCNLAIPPASDWWPRVCENDPATGKPLPRELCFPPLPKS